MSSSDPPRAAPAPRAAAPAPARVRRWERLGHVVQEVGTGRWEVRDPSGRVVGWIASYGTRFQAIGVAGRPEDAPVLGTFRSGTAAVRLVIGYDEVQRTRAETLREVRRLEREHVSPPPRSRSEAPARPSAGTVPSARSGGGDAGRDAGEGAPVLTREYRARPYPSGG